MIIKYKKSLIGYLEKFNNKWLWAFPLIYLLFSLPNSKVLKLGLENMNNSKVIVRCSAIKPDILQLFYQDNYDSAYTSNYLIEKEVNFNGISNEYVIEFTPIDSNKEIAKFRFDLGKHANQNEFKVKSIIIYNRFMDSIAIKGEEISDFFIINETYTSLQSQEKIVTFSNNGKYDPYLDSNEVLRRAIIYKLQ